MGLGVNFYRMGSRATLGERFSGPCVFPCQMGWAPWELAGGGTVSEAAHCRPQNLVRWCDSSPCKNGGRCWQTNALYRCECHSGWTGLYCDVPSVSCEVAAWQQGNRPCPDLARASPQPPGVWPLRSGGLLSGGEPRPHDPSTSSPAGINVTHLCRNGGLCMNVGNTHHCHCQAGYTGSYCEDQVDECSPSPCQNGATCTDYPGGYSCEVGTRPW